MTAPEIPCPSCSEPTGDGLLCRRCTSRLRHQLTEIPHLLHDLQDNYLRLAQTGTGNTTSRSATTALPYDWAAATTRDSVMHTLGAWFGQFILGETRTLPTMAANARSLTGWLLRHLPELRGHQAAAQFADEISATHHALRTAIDTPQPRIHVGTCPLCGHDVTAPADADEAICRRCEWAGARSVLPVDRSQQPQWAKAADRLVTRTTALDTCAHLGTPVNVETFRSWAKRGHLAARTDPEHRGRRLYRLGDVLDLAKASRDAPRNESSEGA